MSSSEHSASSTLKSTHCTLALSPGAHSSCKAEPAAAQGLQDSPPEPETMIPRMVQPQWLLLAAETENSSREVTAAAGAVLLPASVCHKALVGGTITYFLSSCLPQSENASEEAGEGEYVNLYSSGQSNGELPGSEGVSNSPRGPGGAALPGACRLHGAPLHTLSVPLLPQLPGHPCACPLLAAGLGALLVQVQSRRCCWGDAEPWQESGMAPPAALFALRWLFRAACVKFPCRELHPEPSWGHIFSCNCFAFPILI